jgi:hypothetical protein
MVGPPSNKMPEGTLMEVAMSDLKKTDPNDGQASGCIPALSRLLWMVLGSGAIFFIVIAIAFRKAPYILDAVLWVAVILVVLIRYIDITRFKGQTTEGEPANLQHWRRYTAGLVITTGSLYILARILAYFRLL